MDQGKVMVGGGGLGNVTGRWVVCLALCVVLLAVVSDPAA